MTLEEAKAIGDNPSAHPLLRVHEALARLEHSRSRIYAAGSGARIQERFERRVRALEDFIVAGLPSPRQLEE